MAMAGKLTVVQTHHVCDLGQLPANESSPPASSSIACCMSRGDPAAALTGGTRCRTIQAPAARPHRHGGAGGAGHPGGRYVNLGIGIPTLMADYFRPTAKWWCIRRTASSAWGRRRRGEEDPWLVNAGKQPVTLRPGGSYLHHADSFAMVRGGHLDLCVLGGFQVAANGDLANWAHRRRDRPAVGGAMDLAVGAKQIWVVMEHTTKDGGRSCGSAAPIP